jgi:dihydroorotate dehydrogenase (fumarate)
MSDSNPSSARRFGGGSLVSNWNNLKSTRYGRAPLGVRFFQCGYKRVGKPFIFMMEPDKAHDLTVTMSERFGGIAMFDRLLHDLLSVDDDRLKTTVMGNTYNNPFGLAAGLDKNAQLLKILDAAGFGFSSFGSMTYEQCDGNPRPWFHRLPQYDSLLIHAGLPNVGAGKVLDKSDEITTPYGLVRHASVGFTNKTYPGGVKEMIADFTNAVRLDMESKTNVVEVNISCPNLTEGKPFQEPGNLDELFTIIDGIRPSDGSKRKPILVKMPNADTRLLGALLEVLNDHDVQGVATCNLLEDRTGYEVPSDWEGSMSGKPCHQQALDAVKYTRDTYGDRFAVEGIGGVFTVEDALEMIDAGADLVGFVSTLMFNGPQQASLFASGLLNVISYSELSEAGKIRSLR